MTDAGSFTVTEPGAYDGMPEDVYHGDPVPGGSLSSTGARKLLPPSCPAKFRWEQDNPPETTGDLDLGKAAHRMALGCGAPFVVVDAGDWRTKAARQARDEAHAAGAVPLLNAAYEQIMAMAKAIREHPLAGPLLCRGDVQAEQSLFWIDQEYGVWRRARLDAVRRGGRLLIADYKTTRSACPPAFAKSVHEYGYHQQAAWYLDAAAAVLGDEDAAFVFAAQEKTPPYLVSVCELDAEALAIGRARNRAALERYRDCRESGVWPGYSGSGEEIELISLPPWAARQHCEGDL